MLAVQDKGSFPVSVRHDCFVNIGYFTTTLKLTDNMLFIQLQKPVVIKQVI